MTEVKLMEVLPQLNPRSELGRVVVSAETFVKPRVTGSIFMCCNRAFLTAVSYGKHRDSGECGKSTNVVSYESGGVKITPTNATESFNEGDVKPRLYKDQAKQRVKKAPVPEVAPSGNLLTHWFSYSSPPYGTSSTTSVPKDGLDSFSQNLRCAKLSNNDEKSINSAGSRLTDKTTVDVIDVMSIFKTSKSSNGTFIFSCRQCAFVTNIQKEIFRHVTVSHPLSCKKENISDFNDGDCNGIIKSVSNGVKEEHGNGFINREWLTCSLCNVFKTKHQQNLNAHKKHAHSGTSTGFACPKCSCNYPTKKGMLQHFQRYHSGQVSENKIEMESSRRDQENVGNLSPLTPSSNINFIKQWKKIKGKANYKCNRCLLMLSSQPNLRRHLKVAHVPDGKFPCTLCPCVYGTRSSLRTHFTIVHKGKTLPYTTAEGQTPKALFIANWVKQASEQLKNVTVDNPEDDLQTNGLEEEEEEEHKTIAKQLLHKCKFCQKRFSKKSLLIVHCRTKHRLAMTSESGKHNNVKGRQSRNRCNICQRNFSWNRLLQDHKNSCHVVGGSYPCPIKECKCVFGGLKNLLPHLRKWHNLTKDQIPVNPTVKNECLSDPISKPEPTLVSCELCGITIGNELDLNSHLKNSHVVCGVSCLCGCSFASASELTKHKRLECPKSRIEEMSTEDIKDVKVSSSIPPVTPRKSRRHFPAAKCSCGLESCKDCESSKQKDTKLFATAEKESLFVKAEPPEDESEQGVKAPDADKSVACSKCNLVFKNMHGLRVHMFYMHFKKGGLLECEICHYPNMNWKTYRLHKDRCHVKDGIQCPNCRCSFRTIEGISKHFRMMHKNKIFDRTSFELKCNECDFVAFVKSELLQHEKVAHQQDSSNTDIKMMYKCPLCDHEAPSVGELDRHTIANHVEDGFKCDFCNCSFGTEVGRRVHAQMKHVEIKQEYLVCEICKYPTRNQKNYKDHKRRCHVENGIQCPDCPCSLREIMGLHHHVLMLHKWKINKKDYELKCSHCEYTTYSKTALEQHEVKHSENDSISILNVTSAKNEVCTICNNVVRTSLEDHLATAHVEGGYECSQCKCSFRTETGLHWHLRRRHLIKVDKAIKKYNYDHSVHIFSCTRCDFRSKTRQGLSTHSLKSHGFKVPFLKSSTITRRTCNLCSLSFSGTTAAHKRRYHVENGFKCNHCSCSFETYGSRLRHMVKSHKIGSQSCSLCGFKFTGSLNKHLTMCHVEDGIKCNYCCCTFKSEQARAFHAFRAHNQVSTKECDLCGLTLTESIDYHMKKCHVPDGVKCDHCSCAFTNEAGKIMHMRIRHLDLLPVSPTSCPLCGVKVKGNYLLKYHLTHNHVENGVSCPRCSCSFSSENALRLHMKIKHGEVLPATPKTCSLCGVTVKSNMMKYHLTHNHVENGVSCPRCSCSFSSENSRRQHMKMKHGEAIPAVPKTCSLCGVKVKSNMMKYHLRNSHVKNGHPCRHCSCSFKSENSMKRHMKRKHGETVLTAPKKCVLCDRRVKSSMMKYHMLHNHAKNGHSCSKCPCKFRSKVSLKRHMTKLHNIRAKPAFEKCGLCGGVTFGCKLHEHMKRCHVKDGLKCPDCPCSFKSIEGLSGHFRILHKNSTLDRTSFELKCSECDFVTFTQLELMNHEKAGHEQESPCNEIKIIHQCKICDYIAPNVGELDRHSVTNHVEDGFKCDFCSCSFGTEAGRRAHAKMKHVEIKQEYLVCEICKYFTVTQKNYKDHKRRLHVENGIQCPDCPCSMREITGLYNHVLMLHKRKINKKDYELKCGRCEFTTYSKTTLEQHEARHDGNHVTLPNKEFEVCTICNNIIRSSLEDHLATAHVEGGNECSHCKCSFRTEIGLRWHLLKRHGIKADKAIKKYDHSVHIFSCTRCDFRSKTGQGLSTHSFKMHGFKVPYTNAKHHGIVRRICSLCNMWFSGTAAAHKRIYHVENGLQCDHCCCSFESENSRMRHMVKTHQVTKQCDMCGLKFAATLKKHIMKCHVTDGLKCNYCSCTFSNESGRLIHMSKRHNVAVSRKICSLCGVKLKHYSMEYHLRHNHVENGLSCSHCSCSFGSEIGRRHHLKSRHGIAIPPAPRKCSLCGISVKSNLLKYHMENNHVQNGYSCTQCPCSFRSEKSKLQHMTKLHKIKPPVKKCQLCGMKVHSNLNEHLRSHHSSNGFQCSHCSCKLRTKEGRRIHILKTHKNSTAKEEFVYLNPNNACRLCGIEVSERLEDHIRRCHCVTNPFTCSQCNCRFLTKIGLTRHFLIHHKVKTKTVSSGSGSNPSIKKRRKKVNNGANNPSAPSPRKESLRKNPEKNIAANDLQCSECASTFPSEKALRIHKKVTHSSPIENDTEPEPTPSSNVYQVVDVDGNSDTSCISIPKNKEEPRIQLPKEKLSCIKCGYVATCLSHLNIHIQKSHVKDSLYPCTRCTCGYATEPELSRHMRIFHPVPAYIVKELSRTYK